MRFYMHNCYLRISNKKKPLKLNGFNVFILLTINIPKDLVRIGKFHVQFF